MGREGVKGNRASNFASRIANRQRWLGFGASAEFRFSPVANLTGENAGVTLATSVWMRSTAVRVAEPGNCDSTNLGIKQVCLALPELSNPASGGR